MAASAALEEALQRPNHRTSDGHSVLDVIRSAPLWKPAHLLRFVPTKSAMRRSLDNFTLARAALELGHWDLYDLLRKRLLATLRKSGTVHCLCFGMRLEAREKWERAATCYVELIERDATNVLAYKRQVAVMKSQGLVPEAVACLNQYLQFYPVDSFAWAELCDLYVSMHNYTKAVFCASELTILMPSDWASFCRMADILYTLGEDDALLRARYYYSKSLSLQPKGNLRSLYGLWLTCRALTRTTLSDEKNESLREWASRGIRHTYESLRDHPAEKAAALALIN